MQLYCHLHISVHNKFYRRTLNVTHSLIFTTDFFFTAKFEVSVFRNEYIMPFYRITIIEPKQTSQQNEKNRVVLTINEYYSQQYMR